jgi:FMN-dependent NADH-azoreductase
MTIAGFYTQPAEMTPELRAATALSDELIGEILAADELLIATPMYNFTVPAALKAWIDQIVRIGKTFQFDGTSFQGLVKARRAVVISAYGAGGYLNGGPFAAADFCGPYFKFLLNFLGIANIESIAVEATVGDATVLAEATNAAKGRIALAAAA